MIAVNSHGMDALDSITCTPQLQIISWCTSK